MKHTDQQFIGYHIVKQRSCSQKSIIFSTYRCEKQHRVKPPDLVFLLVNTKMMQNIQYYMGLQSHSYA
jgi:hypothetical protein